MKLLRSKARGAARLNLYFYLCVCLTAACFSAATSAQQSGGEAPKVTGQVWQLKTAIFPEEVTSRDDPVQEGLQLYDSNLRSNLDAGTRTFERKADGKRLSITFTTPAQRKKSSSQPGVSRVM